MSSRRWKRNNCGPPCHSCWAPILDEKAMIVKRNSFHMRCFPCRFCKKSKNGDIMFRNGYHHDCQPCKGCGKPFNHSDRDVKYCTKRCETSAPVMDIILVSTRRKNIYIPKVILKEIHGFLYGRVFVRKVEFPRVLSDKTISYIAEIEEKYRLRLLE